MKKRGYIIIISVLLLGVLVGIGRGLIERNKNYSYKKDNIEEYGFEISYPKVYENIKASGEKKLLSNLEITESGEYISEYMKNLNLVETVRELKNKNNGIRMTIEAIKTKKTSLELEEICKRYVVMFKIYNEDREIKENTEEIIELNETKVGKVTLKLKTKEEDATLIAYLISLDDREITITFIAPASNIEKYDSEIKKIVSTLRVY